MSWMITASGAQYHLCGPGALAQNGRPILINDIAHHLALVNRWNGATRRPYSVAEHSVLCSEIAQRSGHSLLVQLAALLHDGHEAYVGDMSSPAKQAINFRSIAAGGTRAWDVFENEHAQELRAHFGLALVMKTQRTVLNHIDLLALATERRDLSAWNSGKHEAWEVIEGKGIEPIDWMRLDTPEREAMGWQDWRQQFIDRYDEIVFARDLLLSEGRP